MVSLACSSGGARRNESWSHLDRRLRRTLILIISDLAPVVHMSWILFSIPIPEPTDGWLLQKKQRHEAPARRRT